MLRWIALWCIVVFVGVILFRPDAEPLPQEFIDAGVNKFVRENRLREPIELTQNGQIGVYRSITSSEELLLFYPNCCSFNTYDPEGPKLSALTRRRYDVRGYVFIKAGRVKISGYGPNLRPSPETVYILNGDFENVYSKIF